MPAEVCFVWLVYCVTETRRLKTDLTTAASPVLLRQSAEAELWLPLVAGQPSTVSLGLFMRVSACQQTWILSCLLIKSIQRVDQGKLALF